MVAATKMVAKRNFFQCIMFACCYLVVLAP